MDQTGVKPIKDTSGYEPERRQEMNTISNPLRIIYYGVAGGPKLYAKLSKDDRAKCREVARTLHEMGVDYTTALHAEKTDKRGFVYVITHPMYPEYVKIGRAFNPESRLRGYQTGCPFRGYKLHYSVYFHDCYQAEREMHLRLDRYKMEGEWFALAPHMAEYAINNLRETI